MKNASMRIAMVGLCVLCVAALTLATGCAAKASAVTIDTSGNSVTLEKSQELKVKVEGNPSTGFSWVVVDNANGILEQVGEPEIEEPKTQGSSQIVGQAQMLVFTFKTVKSGSAALKMEYKRSWETTVPAEKSFSVDVTVK